MSKERESGTRLRFGRLELGPIDPVCLLALLFAMAAFALVIDCRNRQSELELRGATSAHESNESERAADRSEENDRDVHVVDVGP